MMLNLGRINYFSEDNSEINTWLSNARREGLSYEINRSTWRSSSGDLALLLRLNIKKSLLFNYLENRKTCGKSFSDIKYVSFSLQRLVEAFFGSVNI
jgi:hypothetical protein